MTDAETYLEIVRLTEVAGKAVVHKNGEVLDNQSHNLMVVPYNSPQAIKERGMEMAGYRYKTSEWIGRNPFHA